MASSATPVHEPAKAPASGSASGSASASASGSPDRPVPPPGKGGVAGTPRPHLAEGVAARLAAWEAAEELRRAREEQEAAAVAEAAEAARAARGAQRRAPGGQKSSASLASTSKHHGGDKSRPDPNRPRVQSERFRLRHGATAEEMLRDYRRLVTYPRQCPVLKAQLVLRSRPLPLDHAQAAVCSRYRQAAAEYQLTSPSIPSKHEVVVVSTAPAVTDFRNPPKQGGSRLPPPRWDRWLASRHPPEREEAALVPTPVHMPPLPGEAPGTSVWAAIGARDSWTSFKLDSPPPTRSASARQPQSPPPRQPQSPPPRLPQSPPPRLPPLPLAVRAQPPPPPPPPARVLTGRLDLESCLSVVSLQAPDIAPAYRPRPQPPPARRFELLRNLSSGDSPAAGLSVAPVVQPARPPAARRRRPSPPPPQPEPALSQPATPLASPTSSLPSSHSAPTSPRTIPQQGRR